MEIAELPNIPMNMNVALDKRKSKVVRSKGSTGLLDISSLPELTRNVSETQLLALKNAGTKALSNMTEQFSKLNKLSHSFNAKRPIDAVGKKQEGDSPKPVFTLGNRDIEGNTNNRKSSDSSSEDEAQIRFDEPDQTFERPQMLPEAYLPTVGIVMGVKNESIVDSGVKGLPRVTQSATYTGELGEKAPPVDRPSIASTTPEITIEGVEDKEKIAPPSTLNLPKNISHSSGEVDNSKQESLKGSVMLDEDSYNRLSEKMRSNSEKELTLNITSSQSESALKSIGSNIVNITSVTSPVTVSANILSPFSKFAKGVQILGANLDPRKLKPGQTGITRNLSDQHLEQRQKLQERWGKCKSKLIAL